MSKWLLLRLVLLAVTLVLAQCQAVIPAAQLRLNELQFLGSHNSYKLALDEVTMARLVADNPAVARSLDYAHATIAEQLSLGLRNLELDVFHDPQGGRFANPMGAAFPGADPYDGAVMKRPGFKVLHVQDIDFRSHCLTFVDCLQQISTWSTSNPGHLPIFVLINAKDSVIDLPGFVVPLKFDAAAWDALDDEIRAVLGDSLLAPDDLRLAGKTLRESVLVGWPVLDAVRGKVVVVLDDSPAKKASYVAGHASLAGRAMFVDAPEDSDEAAIRVMNNPVVQLAEIQALVKQGFIVRTRADADTREARTGSLDRLRAALASGAQMISTDYYLPERRFGHSFHVTLPNGERVRCNPLLKDKDCVVGNLP